MNTALSQAGIGLSLMQKWISCILLILCKKVKIFEYELIRENGTF